MGVDIPVDIENELSKFYSSKKIKSIPINLGDISENIDLGYICFKETITKKIKTETEVSIKIINKKIENDKSTGSGLF